MFPRTVNAHMILAAMLIGTVGPAAGQVSHPEIVGHDGLRLQATLYEAAERGPALLLHHMCGGWRAEYHALARVLRTEGFTVLTYDLRGQGQTGGPTPFEGGRATPEALDVAFTPDSEAALVYLESRPSVDQYPPFLATRVM